MKNIKINRRLMAAIGTVILLPNLVACSFKQNDRPEKETYVVEESVLNNRVQYLVIVVDGVEKIIPVETLRLVNSKNEVVEKVDGVVVGDKIMDIGNPVDILFSLDITKVIVGNDMLPVSEFSLINVETNEKLTNIVGMYVDYQYVDLSDNPLFNDNRLTDEKFFMLVDEVYKTYHEANLDITREEVVDYLMLVNIEQLATDNNELVTTIIGERNVDMVVTNAFNVYSAILTENNDRYCAKGLGFDSIIKVSDTVFDKEEKEVVVNIEKRVREIVLAKDNKEEFNKLLNALLMDMMNAEKEEFNMESGVGYSVMTVLINFVRINFLTDLDKTNSELIKYFVTFASDGVKYEENSMSTAYYRGIYSLITDCVKDEHYTKTK